MKVVPLVASDWTGNTAAAVPDDTPPATVVAKWPLFSPADWPDPNIVAVGNSWSQTIKQLIANQFQPRFSVDIVMVLGKR